MNNIKFDDLIGKTGILCAVEGNKFRIGDLTFEAVEDEEDGYRSSLKEVKLIGEKLRPTFKEEVTITEAGNECSLCNETFTGIKLINNLEKVIIAIGTDNYDDYYPCFAFRYDPTMLTENINIDKLLNQITE